MRAGWISVKSQEERGDGGVQPSKRTKRLFGRAIAPIVAALIVGFCLTYPGSDWFERLQRWLQPASHAAPLRKLARAGPVGPPITVTPMRPSGNDSSVSRIPLPLILVRTQPGRNNREGLAQIGVNARSPQTYTAGALLANGARLSEIYPRYVVLERDGHSARLYLQNEGAPQREADERLLTVGGRPPPVAAVATSQEGMSVYLRPNPVFVGDRLHGYALYPGRKYAPFSQLGLQPGDVLTGINGTAVSAGSLATLQTLAEGAALTVEIERQGVPQTLSLDGSVLTNAIALDQTLKTATGPKPIL
jgi:hypothetical protein